MFQQLFQSRTFTDHMGEPSLGRKAIFCVLLFMGLFAVFALMLVATTSKTPGKDLSSLALGIIGFGVATITLFYGSAQAAKGMAQLGTGTPSLPNAASSPNGTNTPGPSTDPNNPSNATQPGLANMPNTPGLPNIPTVPTVPTAPSVSTAPNAWSAMINPNATMAPELSNHSNNTSQTADNANQRTSSELSKAPTTSNSPA